MSSTAVTQLLPLRTLALLLLTLAGVVAPHAHRLPPWITAAVLLCLLWRYQVGSKGWQLPQRWLLLMITFIASAGVYVSYGTLLGLDAGVATLTAMLGLKLLELRRRRDTVVILYLGFFLVITHLIYSQAIIAVGYMFIAVWAMVMLLITVTRPSRNHSPLEHGPLAATLLLQAIPIMVLLFVLFPRVPGPLWGMPEHQTRATTGLSDSMSPGTIGELTQSDAVAFRVEFNDTMPAQRTLYWRGPVLSSYNGRTWSQPANKNALAPTMNGIDDKVDYTVTLEPNNMPWIFTLDMPTQVSTLVQIGSEYQVRQDGPVRDRLRYSASSMLQYQLEPTLTNTEAAAYLTIPEGAHPRTVALARQWRQEEDSTDAFIRRALEYFRKEPFTYTLSPQVMRNDPVDEFLFDIRRGFCEHFAGAFAVMMRAGGVPSRVVTGYQGGELNRSGGYLIVRQSEAHAWTEVHLQGEGWKRIDPTAWVAPDRIEYGLASALPDTDQLPLFSRRNATLLHTLNLHWDTANAYWHRWILAYGPELQQHIMKRMGLSGWLQMIAALTVSIMVAAGLLILLILRGNRGGPKDPAVIIWEKFCRSLSKAGITRQQHEGPRDFAARATRKRPDLSDTIRQVTECFIAIRYSRSRDKRRELRALQTAFKAFRLHFRTKGNTRRRKHSASHHLNRAN